ncbi:MAG: RNA 2',3'-cyclic phosphodiesterase [Coriobacteriia bacterium]|nr:RNA 2',3'-cyclic phosphodiesterase [Coriobacteriia bacterium]
MVRAFLAVTMPVSVRSTFQACREAFVSADPAWAGEKWVAPENLHVTLRFLGMVSESQTDEVIRRVGESVSGVDPYRLRLDVVRAIPRPRSASLLWIAPSAGGDETSALAERIASSVSFLDFKPDGRSFKTHVTLCRARHPRRVPSDALDVIERVLHRAEERAVSVSVRSVTLFQSTLTPRGPVYAELATIPLGM